MDLQNLKSEFTAGKIPKAEYIQRMHALHAKLYEYAEFIQKTSVEKIEISNGQVIVTMRGSGLKIIVDPKDHRIAPIDALNFGEYERAETEMMLRLVDDGNSIFDIGANIGWYSLMLAKHFKHVQVHAFEPIAATFSF